jgi:hypothetical protein
MARIWLSFDDALLRRINRVAEASGKSLSTYLSELAAYDAGAMNHRMTTEARLALSSLDRLFADSPAGESTSVVRAMRDGA